MKIILLSPPVYDPTQPYISVPSLSAFLKQKGYKEIFIKDVNIEAFDSLLSKRFLSEISKRYLDKISVIEKKNRLSLLDQREYFQTISVLKNSVAASEAIEEAKEGLRDKKRFYDLEEYVSNWEIIDTALDTIRTVYNLLAFSFMYYSTRSYFTSLQKIFKEIELNHLNPFGQYYTQKLIPDILAKKPNLVGISIVYNSQIMQALSIAHCIKRVDKHIHIMLGGPAITKMGKYILPKHTEIFSYVDSIVFGEGEYVLYEVVKRLRDKKQNLEDIKSLAWYNRKNNKLWLNTELTVVDINSLPPPDYSGLQMKNYFTPESILLYSPTRSCYWKKCAFCDYGFIQKLDSPYREKKVSLVIDELKYLAEKFKVKYFYFSVDVIAPKMLRELSKALIRNNLKIKWRGDIRLEKEFTLELCQLMKKAGCIAISVGFESGCDRILSFMDKGINSEQAKYVLRNLSKAGIATDVQCFLGFPTETPEEAIQTLDFISKNIKNISAFYIGRFILLYGSTVYKFPERFHIRKIFPTYGGDWPLVCSYKMQSKYRRDHRAEEQIREKQKKLQKKLIWSKIGILSRSDVFSEGSTHSTFYFERYGKDFLKTKKRNGLKYIKQVVKRRILLNMKPQKVKSLKIFKTKFDIGRIKINITKATKGLSRTAQEDEKLVIAHFKKLNSEWPNLLPSKKYICVSQTQPEFMSIGGDVKRILDCCKGEKTVKEIVAKFGSEHKNKILTCIELLYTKDLIMFS